MLMWIRTSITEAGARVMQLLVRGGGRRGRVTMEDETKERRNITRTMIVPMQK